MIMKPGRSGTGKIYYCSSKSRPSSIVKRSIVLLKFGRIGKGLKQGMYNFRERKHPLDITENDWWIQYIKEKYGYHLPLLYSSLWLFQVGLRLSSNKQLSFLDLSQFSLRYIWNCEQLCHYGFDINPDHWLVMKTWLLGRQWSYL